MPATQDIPMRQRLYELDMSINQAFREGKAVRVCELVEIRSKLLQSLAESGSIADQALLRQAVDVMHDNMKKASKLRDQIKREIAANAAKRRVTCDYSSTPQQGGRILRQTA